MAAPMDRSPLEDPASAAFAWARYRRILGYWTLFTLAVVVAVLGWMAASYGVDSIHAFIATALAVGLTMELGGALMGLVFLSSGTGHDEAVRDFTPEDQDSDG